MRARILLVPGTAQRSPAPGEVAVEVHVVRVLTRVRRYTVRIQVVDDPEPHARWGSAERPRDRDAGRLVAVHAAHHHHLPAGACVADLDGGDPPSLDRPAEGDAPGRAPGSHSPGVRAGCAGSATAASE